MFGYVTICEPELKVKDLRKYKAYYCGLCHILKEKYGISGQMTLTYDMTFAIILLTSLYELSLIHILWPAWRKRERKDDLDENGSRAYKAYIRGNLL